MTEKIHYQTKDIQTHSGKSESTKAEYLKTAENFLIRELDKKDIARTAGNICKALKSYSINVRPATYRKMQCSLEYHQYVNKFYKAAQQIRDTQRHGHGEISGKKQKICKSVKESEHIKLLKAALAKEDDQVVSALTIAYYLGLRPAEMPRIRVVQEDENGLSLHIIGAKKKEDGTRGMDKEIHLNIESNAKYALMSSINTLSGIDTKNVNALKRRVSRLSKKVFPSRKHPPTLYSYRHQLGSDLNGSKDSKGLKALTRKQAAAVMGHQSQASLSQYGHANNASMLKRSLPTASQSTVEQVLENSEETNYKAVKLKAEYDISSEPVNTEQEQGGSEPTSASNGSMAVFILEKLAEDKVTVRTSRHDDTNNDDDDYGV